MNKNKLISILLIFVLLFPLFSFLIPEANVLAAEPTYYSQYKGQEFASYMTDSEWATYKQNNGIISTVPKSKNGYPFNLVLWHERGKIVYGNYKSFGESNDFKAGRQINEQVVQGGYYIRNSVRGEYRWHGYDISGNKYENQEFINDANNSKVKVEDRYWLFKPWDKGITTISPWNRRATDNPTIRNWINNGIGFKILRGEDLSYKEPDGYINIYTPPSTRYPGDGNMWHLTNRGTSSEKMWYQTFSIKQIAEKEEIPLVGQIEVLGSPTLDKDQDKIMIKAEILGHLQDEAYYNDQVLKTQYYVRNDIDKWEFSLANATVSPIKEPHVNINRTAANKGKGYFEVLVPRASLETNPNVNLTGTVKLYFANGKTMVVPVQKSIKVTVKDDLTSLFTISNNIELVEGDSLYQSHIGYRDASYGKITQYSITVEEHGTSNSSNRTYTTINNDTVNSFLHSFISPKVSGLIAGDTKQFKVTQTVTDGKKQSSYVQVVTIKIVEGKVPVIAIPEIGIPDYAFDIVPISPTDTTDPSTYVSREVYVDGKLVNNFFGSYTFGIGNDGIRQVYIRYVSPDGIESHFLKWIKVYNTQPVAHLTVEGSSKVNRKMTINNDSITYNNKIVDNAFVSQYYPITSYNFSYKTIEGQEINLKFKDISEIYKEFLSKGVGTYEFIVTATNTLGRTSKPYIATIHIFEDYKPAIEANIWNSVLGRNESLNTTISTSSTDGDNIASSTLKIYWDSNNDGTTETLLATYDTLSFTTFTPTKLGKYKMVIDSKEEFGEETIPEFVTEEDRKTATLERDFFVENYRPVTDLFIDIPVNQPKVDVFFMNDRNLEATKNEWIINNRINMANNILLDNIIPNVNIWDLKTYVYSQSASTTRNTGSSYPPSTTSYSSGGYSGTLSRYKVVDNGSYQDFGRYITVTDSKTADGTRSGTGWAKYDCATDKLLSSGGTNQPTMSYSSGGYTGTLYKYDVVKTGDSTSSCSGGSYTVTQYFTGYYSGTVTKTSQVWESDMRWVSSYTGYYSGTIYKDVKQPYTNPFNSTSIKYTIYVSDNEVNDMADLTFVQNQAETKLILIGNDVANSQITSDYFIKNNGEAIEVLINKAIDIIKNENKSDETKIYTLVNEPFEISQGIFDFEDDPIAENQFQIVHNANYFDNSMGQEIDTVTSFSESYGWTNIKPSSFANVGEYIIYPRIKDNPANNPNAALYSGSNPLKIYAHRKPIAKATLDWDFDPVSQIYLTTWVDESYDLDHEFSDPEKGIVERKIRYRVVGGEWIYKIPNELQPGKSYELEYFVRDIENTWSDPFVMSFTLNTTPGMQLLDAKVKPSDPQFSLSSIPASENILVYDVWTRYPYDTHLEIAIYQGVTRKTNIQKVTFTEGVTGTKKDNDIHWNPIVHNIPSTLPDGNYTIKIQAIGVGGQIATKDFPIIVKTPVNLQVTQFGDMTNVGGGSYDIKTETSKYVSNMQVILYKGTSYQTTLTLNGSIQGNKKVWSKAYIPPTTIPENTYVAEFSATTPNNNNERKTLNYKILSIKIYSYGINHTPEWINYFNQNSLNLGTYLAGEPFDVNVETTPNATEVKVTFNFPQATKKVPIEFLYNEYDNPYPNFAYTFALSTTNNANWSTRAWRKYWIMIPDGTYLVSIITKFSNGATLQEQMYLTIKDHILYNKKEGFSN